MIKFTATAAVAAALVIMVAASAAPADARLGRDRGVGAARSAPVAAAPAERRCALFGWLDRRRDRAATTVVAADVRAARRDRWADRRGDRRR